MPVVRLVVCVYSVSVMIVQTIRERIYEVVANQTCTVTSPDGILISVVQPGVAVRFVAPASFVEVSDESACVTPTFNSARRLPGLPSAGSPASEFSSKYEACTSGAEMSAVQSDYLADISCGVWPYSLDNLSDGDGVFELASGLRDFCADLPCLQSGMGMFSECVLSRMSLLRIADSVPVVSGAALTLGVDIRLKNHPDMQKVLTVLEDKGWMLEIRYNTPANVVTLAELEYIESSGTQYIDSGIVTDGTYTVNMKLQGFNSWGRICGRSNYPDSESLILFRGSPSDHAGEFVFYYGKAYALLKNNYSYDGTEINEIECQEGKNRVIINGSSVSLSGLNVDSVKTGNPAGQTHWIFDSNGGFRNGGRRAAMKLFYYRLRKSDGQYVFDAVPVLDEMGVAALYDKVSGRYFYNSGTGEFKWELKSGGYARRGALTPLILPQYPVWARLRNGRVEWGHYVSHPNDGWQQFPSLAEALQHLEEFPL